jgi:hypothetical protein
MYVWHFSIPLIRVHMHFSKASGLSFVRSSNIVSSAIIMHFTFFFHLSHLGEGHANALKVKNQFRKYLIIFLCQIN